jgi:cell division protein FtsI (penicillin-binding protein 3)
VISDDTARTLMHIMTQVVEHGTGHAAAIPGYAVAGKTGTAQKLDPATRRYSHAPGVLSFVGTAPADDPRFVMLVMLDEPKNEKWGSEAAAPIFSAIGREILRHLDVPPRDVQPMPIVMASAPEAGVARPGILETDSTPSREARGPREQTAVVDTASESSARAQAGDSASSQPGPAFMPDLRGKPLRQALATLAALRADVELVGSGIVVQQTPAAGAPIAGDGPVRLTLARSTAVGLR